MKNILLLGPPGSGKGTQAARLTKKWGFSALATGQIIRDEIASGSALGQEIQEVVAAGKFCDDNLVNEVVSSFLKKRNFSVSKEAKKQLPQESGLIFDGYPRTLNQAKFLESVLEGLSLSLDHVIAFDLPEELLKQRIVDRRVCKECGENYNISLNPPQKQGICDACGGDLYQRSDDNLASFQNRIKIYRDLTDPIIAYFEDKMPVHHIDASQSLEKIEEIFTRILR